jgi:hypothetical protein
MTNVKRWRGLRALIGDAVEHGSSAIERVHLATAGRTFAVLEQIPVIAEPARAIHQIHDTVVANTYGTIREVNRVVGDAIDAALDQLEYAAKDDQS